MALAARARRMSTQPTIPPGWHELPKNEIIGTDDKIWAWGEGPWIYVGGSIIGERYGRESTDTTRHWTIIREDGK